MVGASEDGALCTTRDNIVVAGHNASVRLIIDNVGVPRYYYGTAETGIHNILFATDDTRCTGIPVREPGGGGGGGVCAFPSSHAQEGQNKGTVLQE